MRDEADRGPQIVLHSTWTGIVLASAGAVLLIGLAALLWIDRGVDAWSVVVTLAAVGGGAVVLFDLPVASAFDRDGVTRRAMLRHQRLPWSKVTRLKRSRAGVVRTRSAEASGGLVADVGRRHYLLVDKMESAIEFDELARVLGPEAERLGLGGVFRPPDGRSPTWMYRRRRWRPPTA